MPNLELEVYLVDDGSTDGTAEAVQTDYPTVHVIRGTGNLYWGGAMRLADAAAWPSGPDYVLWLNDDVRLMPNAINCLVATALDRKDEAIIVGAVADPVSGAVSYGGHRVPDRRRPITFKLVAPTGKIEDVETMNGNVVLLPAAVRERVGPLDVTFSHNMADIDYALRARWTGTQVCLAPDFVGTCAPNHLKESWRWRDTPLRARWQHILSRKGTPPREWFVFTRRHAARHWPRYFLAPYIRALIPWSRRRPQAGVAT